MVARFWVGGAGTWDNASTAHWSSASGGAGGSSVPAPGDSVTFDENSGDGVVTVAAAINDANTILSLTTRGFAGRLYFGRNFAQTFWVDESGQPRKGVFGIPVAATGN